MKVTNISCIDLIYWQIQKQCFYIPLALSLSKSEVFYIINHKVYADLQILFFLYFS